MACSHLRFESRVVLDGNQAPDPQWRRGRRFESRVVLDGNQADMKYIDIGVAFESRVVLDGIFSNNGLGKKHVYNRHTKSSPHACSSPPFASVSTTAAIVKWSELPLLSPSEPSKRGGLHTVFLLSYCICALDIVKVDGSSPFNPMKATHCEWFFCCISAFSYPVSASSLHSGSLHS